MSGSNFGFVAVIAFSTEQFQLSFTCVSLLTRIKADRINCTVERQSNLVFTTVSMHLNATVAVIFDGLARGFTPSAVDLNPAFQYSR